MPSPLAQEFETVVALWRISCHVLPEKVFALFGQLAIAGLGPLGFEALRV